MIFVDIFFRTQKLQKDFGSEKALRRKYGNHMAQTIRARLGVLKNARTLSDAPKTKPDRLHQLKGDRDEQLLLWTLSTPKGWYLNQIMIRSPAQRTEELTWSG